MVYNLNGVVISMDDNIAPQFSESTAYAAGDYVLKLQDNGQNVLYKFTAAHAAGAWTGTDAQAVTMASELGDVKSQIAEKADKAGAAPYLAAGDLISSDGNTDQTPYLMRPVPADASNNMALQKIVGGTVAVNQYTTNNTSGWSRASASALTISADSGEITLTSSTNSSVTTKRVKANTISAFANHVFFGAAQAKTDGVTTSAMFALYDSGNSRLATFVQGYTTSYVAGANICKPTSNDNYFALALPNATPSGNSAYFKDVMLVDLTAMFGSNIADYVYGLETATAGAGVAWLRKYFPQFFNAGYLPYNTGELVSVSGLVSHDTVGFNQWDEEWELGTLDNSTGAKVPVLTAIRSKNLIPVIPSATYYINITYSRCCCYDGDGNFIVSTPYRNAGGGAWYLDIPSNARYILFSMPTAYGTTYNHDICINLSDPSRNGEYKPYKRWSYPLDSSLILRGILALDASNKPYFDGDEYTPNGTVTRRYGIRAYQSGDENLADAITDGTNTVYKLASSTTETATPYTEEQACEAGGTEEFVIDSEAGLVASPGNVSFYPQSLKQKLVGLPWDFSTLIASTEKSTTASKAYSVGDYFIYQNTLYKVTASIASGGTITPNTNCTATTIMAEIAAL